jgi:hypothetical protein
LLARKAREGQENAADLARDTWNRQRDTLATAVERGREAFEKAREKETV